jgi:YegS/Rv2252/BmrU family lipid kinase
MKAVFVVNPAAGHGRAGARWSRARALAQGLWPGGEEVLTRAPGHARELARDAAASGAGLVVAVGGDGTLGEAADGWLDAPSAARASCALTTFPAGSGCDFARHAGVPRDPEAWARAMAGAGVRTLDAGRAEFRAPDGTPRARRFLNVAALGLAGEVARAVERRGKPLGGTLTYLLEGALAVLAGRPRRLRLTVDGREEPAADYQLVALANTSTFGGGMRLAPDADAADGRLELLTVGALGRAELLGLLARARSGAHLGRPGVAVRRARRVEVRAEEPLALNLDGEHAPGGTGAVFAAEPGVLRLRL